MPLLKLGEVPNSLQNHIIRASQINHNCAWMGRVQIPFKLEYCQFVLPCSSSEYKLESNHLHHALEPILNLPLSRLSFGTSFSWGSQRIYVQVHGKQNKVIFRGALLAIFGHSNSFTIFATLMVFPKKFKGCEKPTLRIGSYRPLSDSTRLYCPILFLKICNQMIYFTQ